MEFEKSLAKLEEIKSKLEVADISLDEAVKLYEESVECTKNCIDSLKKTEGKITSVKSELDKIIEVPLDIEEE